MILRITVVYMYYIALGLDAFAFGFRRLYRGLYDMDSCVNFSSANWHHRITPNLHQRITPNLATAAFIPSIRTMEPVHHISTIPTLFSLTMASLYWVICITDECIYHTRPRAGLRPAGPSESLGGYSSHRYTSHASLRAYGAQLGGLASH